MKHRSQPAQLKGSENKLHVGTIGSLTVTRYRMPEYNVVCRGVCTETLNTTGPMRRETLQSELRSTTRDQQGKSA